MLNVLFPENRACAILFTTKKNVQRTCKMFKLCYTADRVRHFYVQVEINMFCLTTIVRHSLVADVASFTQLTVIKDVKINCCCNSVALFAVILALYEHSLQSRLCAKFQTESFGHVGWRFNFEQQIIREPHAYGKNTHTHRAFDLFSWRKEGSKLTEKKVRDCNLHPTFYAIASDVRKATITKII